jgi:uncharacterized protein YcbK (DUF882 family)
MSTSIYPSKGPSEHLSWKELGCHDGTPYPEKWTGDRLPPLVAAFEALRASWGSPLKVLSAYRSPNWNLKVGGANLSQHVEGRALDIAPLEGFHGGVDADDFHTFVEKQLKGLPQVKGFGRYPWGCHIDVRPRATLISW